MQKCKSLLENFHVVSTLVFRKKYIVIGFQTIVKYLIHSVVTLAGYIGTKNEEG